MEREEKAKVVASVWGAEFIEFLTLPSMILIGPSGPLEGFLDVFMTLSPSKFIYLYIV